MGVENSILQKLKNKAKKTGFSYQLILQLFCQEEFLRRLAYSTYTDSFILKGGLFLFMFTNFQSRPTMDIDFLMKNISNEKENIINIINEIVNTEVKNNYIHLQIKSVENITEQKEYHGLRIKMIGIISNTKTPFDIDIGIGDVIVPKPELRKIAVQIDEFEAPEILTYTLESTIAEKWDAIISRMETTSRMKDYYDIYYLACNFNFDGRKLQEAIFETLQKRGTHYDRETLLKIKEIHKDQNMDKRWNSFCKNSLEIYLEFKIVIDIIVNFINCPFNSIIDERECLKLWNPISRSYE